jgi:hypothetical protein
VELENEADGSVAEAGRCLWLEIAELYAIEVD